jgi:hypothetical protein
VRDLRQTFDAVAISVAAVVVSITSVYFKHRSSLAAAFTMATFANHKDGAISSIAQSIIATALEYSSVTSSIGSDLSIGHAHTC